MTIFDPWNQFGGWDDALPILPDDVIGRWARMLRREHPWRAMAPDDVPGCMRPLLRELLNQARDADERARRRRVHAAARTHGTFRWAQGCTEAHVAEEFALVLDAIRGALRSTGMGSRSVMETAIGVAPELAMAQDAARDAWCSRSAGT